MLRDKLNRHNKDIVGTKRSKPINDLPERYRILANCLKGRIDGTENGTFITKTTDLEDTYCHGQNIILNLDMNLEFQKRHFYYNEKDKILNSKNLLFFDMETTGLGGSGVVPFLIGFGSVTENGFQVRQYFLPDYPDEEMMLEAVRSEINKDTIIVSYNGKSFDMPMLIDRLILHRVERNLIIDDHIDLLHCARRMYRRRLQSCTLSNIERNILDFHRIDDIPGSLVPSIYFSWLNYDETGNLAGVVEHNLYDIVSLFFLMHHFSDVRSNPADKITEPDDILSLAKIIGTGRNHEKVYQTLETFDDITGSYQRYDILFLQSMAYKRSGKLTEAVSLWKKIAISRAEESFLALIELAKYYEHRQKDFGKAIEYALRAQSGFSVGLKYRSELKKRINRLKRKIGSRF